MEVRSKIAVVLTACPFMVSACQRAEIALDDLRPKAGQRGSSDAVDDVGGSAGASSAGSGDPSSGGSGAAGDSTEAAGSGGQDEVDQDVTPPRVLSTSPADGERGVRSDAPIVIRFSEPMNRDQTIGAIELVGVLALPEWDELGTELSLIPVNELEYAGGLDPVYIRAVAYSLIVDRSATDVAGNALGEDYSTTFYTSRLLPRELPEVGELTGYVVGSETRPSTIYVDPSVGDATDEPMVGFISFDLSVLPANTQAVTSATLTATQQLVTRDPYAMGSMMLEHVSFSAFQFVTTAPTKTSFGALFADAATEVATVDVTSAVQAQLAEGGENAKQVQLRFAFERASNPNGVSDYVDLYPVELHLSYLAP